MIAIYQGDSTVTIYPPKIYGFRPDLGLTKRRATQLKPNKIWVDELFYQPEKLYAEALLYVLSKAEEINTTLKNECMACYDSAVEIHSCYMNNPREKVARNFDNAFESIDLWSANDIEKMKDKIQVAFKDKDLTCSHLLRNLFFMDRLKAIVMELVLSIPKLFSFIFFVSLFILPC